MSAWDEWEDMSTALKAVTCKQVQHYLKGVDHPPPPNDDGWTAELSAAAWSKAIDSENIFATATRQRFVARFMKAIGALDRPSRHPHRLKGRGECTVLVAHRGSGKSFLFQALSRAGASATRRTYFVYLNYATAERLPPVQLFCKLLQRKMQGTRVADSVAAVTNVDELVEWLERRNLRIVFLVDEAEAVFAMTDVSLSDQIQSQFIAFGELDDHPPIIAFLTGSSSRIRRLCFGKYLLDEAKADGFVSYSRARDFNGRKYVTEVLDLIHTKEELLGAIKSMNLWGKVAARAAKTCYSPETTAASADGSGLSPVTRTSEDAALFQLFLHSRGVAQAIKDELEGGTTAMMDFMNLKRKDGALQAVWHALLQSIKLAMGEESYESMLSQLRGGTFPTFELPWVRWDTLQSHCHGDNAYITPRLLWDYAHKGFLNVRVESVSEMSPDALLVTFAHASDLWWAAR